MIKKKFVPVLSSSTPSKPTQHKKSSSLQKKSCDSSLENIYRLPSSLKRTEDMISKSILQRQLSSKILDIVGSTFRVKNASPTQSQYFCSPTNFSQFLKYKEYASSEFLETLYEVEGEDGFDNSIHSEHNEVSLLSIHTEQTKRVGETSVDRINMFNSSFSQAMGRVANRSVQLPDRDKKGYKCELTMSLSTGRMKRRASDPAKQVKSTAEARKMSYSLLGDLHVKKDDVRITASVLKSQKTGIGRKEPVRREIPVKQIDMCLNRVLEEESLVDKALNRSSESIQLLIGNEETSDEIRKQGVSGEGIKGQSLSPKKEAMKSDEEKKRLQRNVGVLGSVGDKMKENKVKSGKSGSESEKRLKIMPVTQYDILKRSLDLGQIKSQLLEPKRRVELEIKSRTLASRKE